MFVCYARDVLCGVVRLIVECCVCFCVLCVSVCELVLFNVCVVCVYCVLLSGLVFASCVSACLFHSVCVLWGFKCDAVWFVFECFFCVLKCVRMCVCVRCLV